MAFSLLRISILGLLLAFFCASCGQPAPKPFSPKEKPLVLTSIAPYEFLVKKIGQDLIEVSTIIPSGSNPHSYEPTSRQVLEAARGKIWFRIGEPFEKKAISFFRERSPSLAIYDLRDGIPLLETAQRPSPHCCADHLDRHIWLSPKLAGKQAEAIASALIKHFPQHESYFEKNLLCCLAELDALDQEISNLLPSSENQPLRSIVVSHPAFAYFCHDYHVEQLSVEEEGKDPKPRYLEEILEKAKSGRAEIALALPQYNNKGASMIAKQLHVPVRMINPYAPDYLETMRTLAHLIADPYGTTQEIP